MLIGKIGWIKWVRCWRLFESGFVDEGQIKAAVDFFQFILDGKHLLQSIGEFFAQFFREELAANVAQYRLAVFQADDVDVKLVPTLAMQGHARIMGQLGLSEIFWHTRDYSIAGTLVKNRCPNRRVGFPLDAVLLDVPCHNLNYGP